MPINRFPVGLEMDVSYPDFKVRLTLLSTSQLQFEIKEGPLRHTEIVDIHVVPLGNSIFVVSWQEKDGVTVTNVQDYDRGLIHSHATLSDGRFLRMTGTINVTRAANQNFDGRPQRNRALVLEAMTSLFQRRQVVVDLFRIEGSKLAEHSDVLQDEVPVTAALAGVSMFDPEEASLNAGNS